MTLSIIVKMSFFKKLMKELVSENEFNSERWTIDNFYWDIVKIYININNLVFLAVFLKNQKLKINQNLTTFEIHPKRFLLDH